MLPVVTDPLAAIPMLTGRAIRIDESGVLLKKEDGLTLSVPWLHVKATDAYELFDAVLANRATSRQWLAVGELLDQLPDGRPLADRAYARSLRDMAPLVLPKQGRALVWRYLESKAGGPFDCASPAGPNDTYFMPMLRALDKADKNCRQQYRIIGENLKLAQRILESRTPMLSSDRMGRIIGFGMCMRIDFEIRRLKDPTLRTAIMDFFFNAGHGRLSFSASRSADRMESLRSGQSRLREERILRPRSHGVQIDRFADREST